MNAGNRTDDHTLLTAQDDTARRIRRAAELVEDTKAVEIGSRAVRKTSAIFRSLFGSRSAAIVADANTWKAAGETVAGLLRQADIDTAAPVVLADPDLHATDAAVEEVRAGLAENDAVPIAVGSGTINDLTKRAAYELNRPYMAVATAASMDGYTAFGASINHRGAKQTLFCPAPKAVIADSDILATAPAEMNAAGYADLAAKVVSGADWIISDALEIEPIHETAWSVTQSKLREWLSNPENVRAGNPFALSGLAEGLLMTGFGMQITRSSRPASGAEHQFSHLWDMQHHAHKGRIPFHGFKVGIGSLCSAFFYECLLQTDVERLDVETICRDWPSWDEIAARIDFTHRSEELRRTARAELHAKYVAPETLAGRLRLFKRVWPELRTRLSEQLVPVETLRAMLHGAGAPVKPEKIGIDWARLRQSFYQAQQIRRRFTILDLAQQIGCFGAWLAKIPEKNGF